MVIMMILKIYTRGVEGGGGAVGVLFVYLLICLSVCLLFLSSLLSVSFKPFWHL